MVQAIQKFGFPMGKTIGKLNKMVAILSTIGKQKRPLPFKFRMCSVFQPPLYRIFGVVFGCSLYLRVT